MIKYNFSLDDRNWQIVKDQIIVKKSPSITILDLRQMSDGYYGNYSQSQVWVQWYENSAFGSRAPCRYFSGTVKMRNNTTYISGRFKFAAFYYFLDTAIFLFLLISGIMTSLFVEPWHFAAFICIYACLVLLDRLVGALRHKKNEERVLILLREHSDSAGTL